MNFVLKWFVITVIILSQISCSKKETISAGDHLIILGIVDDFEIFKNNKKPLVFWSGDYQNL